ncbi:MAG: XdhC family protein [Granulosicoccus sp.]
MNSSTDINDIVHRMQHDGNSFAVATVVRTLSVTAAKPGAKAIIDQDGAIVDGWIGGGCTRSAVIKAAVDSIADGQPRLVSIQPEEVLMEQGINAGDEVDGRWLAANLCPSKGSMELFIEPYLANPELIVIGASPVAASVCTLAALFNFTVSRVGSNEQAMVEASLNCYRQWNEVPVEHAHRYIVVATQGAGDLKALNASLAVQSRYIGFVGSHRKTAHLKNKLKEQAHASDTLERIKGPAGLDIGGVTPDEIALSIMAELVQIRRLAKVQTP